MPFPYYARLSLREKAVYRKSDSIEKVSLKAPEEHASTLNELRACLERGEQKAVQRETNRLVRKLMVEFNTPKLEVRVLSRRPASAESELHGLYEPYEDGTAVIKVWMRTAVKKQPVAFRSFLRTVLHEICHHLDYEHFKLEESFHTEGFFKRESHLARQLLGEAEKI